MKPVKYVVDDIASILAHIYNLSMTTGVFPMNMIIAKVTAIYKKGN